MLNFLSNINYNQIAIIFASISAFAVFGYYRNYRYYLNITKKRSIVVKFRDKFIQWCNGRFNDDQLYMQIISESPQIQNLIGNWGISSMKPPFANYILHDWHIILNGIPAIRQFTQIYISDNTINDYIHMVDESLLRSIGAFQTQLDTLRPGLRNPITLFRDGLTAVIMIPIFILAEFGLLTKKTYNWLFGSIIVKSITFLIALIGLTSAIVGLTTDWEDFVEIAKPILLRFGM